MHGRGLTEGQQHGLTWLDRHVPAPHKPYEWHDLPAQQPAPVAPAEEERMWELLGSTLLQQPAAHQPPSELVEAIQGGSLQLTGQVQISMRLCLPSPRAIAWQII